MTDGTRTPDLPVKSLVSEFICNTDSGAGMETVRVPSADAAGQLAGLIAPMVGVLLTFPTWAALAATTGAQAGAQATVVGDAGTHTDPVVGGTVANAGIYSWSSSPAGWRWVAADTWSTLRPDVDAARPSVGELYSSGGGYGIAAAANGASPILDTASQNPIGLTIPSASTGAGSIFVYFLPLTASEITALAGKMIRISAAYTVTSNFLAAKPLQAVGVQRGRIGGTFAGTVVSIGQSGVVLTQVVDYIVVGNETAIGLVTQLASGAVSGADHSIQISSFSWDIRANPGSARGPAGETAEYTAAYKLRSGSSSLYPEMQRSAGVLQNSASFIADVANNIVGYKIPVGTLGGTTNVSFLYRIDPDDLALLRGRTIRAKLYLNTSASFARQTAHTIYCNTATTSVAAVNTFIVKNQQVSSTERHVVVQGDVTSNAQYLAFGVINGNGGGGGDIITAQDDSIWLVDLEIEIVATPSNWQTFFEENRFFQSRVAARRALRAAYGAPQLRIGKQLAVAPSGGDYTDPQTAINNAPPRTELLIAPGSYAANQLYPNFDDVDMRGISRGLSVLYLHQAASSSLANITNNSAVAMWLTNKIRGLKITTQNGRYAVHSDAVNSFYNKKTVIEDCHLEHLGNVEAYNYQVGLGGGGNPSGVWTSTAALGYGIGSGCQLIVRRSTLKGFGYDPVNGHNWHSTKDPCYLLLENCVLDPQSSSANSMNFINIGSRQPDVIEVVGCTLNGPIRLRFTPWNTVLPQDQVANKVEYTFAGHSNSPTPVIIEDEGSRALRIDSATTGVSSSVALSGDAVPIIFGSAITIAGAVGRAGAAYGTWDIGNHQVGPSTNQNITQLGYRLGDCASVNKTLTVAIDGGAPINIVFNANYTAVSNATIEAAIQAALGAAGTVSEFWVNELFRPNFTDEEAMIYNADTTTILRKTAVGSDGTDTRRGKVMTSSMSAMDFIGVALEDIIPGAGGRVKIKGALRVSQDMIRSDGGGAFTYGTMFGVGATAGQFVANPAQPLLAATNTTDVRFVDKSLGDINTHTAWTTYTPSVVSQSGALTTASATGRYKKTGRIVHFQFVASITTNGTGAVAVIVGLPFANDGATNIAQGRESAVTGKAVTGFATVSASAISCVFYDGTYPGGDGRNIVMTGFYEAQS